MATKGKKMNITHTLTLVGGGVLGAIAAGNKVSAMIPFVKDNEKLHFITPAAVGLALKLVGKKNPMLSGLGDGMLVAAAISAVGKNIAAAGIYGYSDSEINDAVAASAEQAAAQVDALLGGGVHALPGLEHSLGDEMNDDMNDDMSDEMNDDMNDEMNDEMSDAVADYDNY
jgi:hypothetical protein